MATIEDIVRQFINSRLHPEEQYRELAKFVDQQVLDAAYAEFQRQVGRVRRFTPPPLLAPDNAAERGWYLGGDNVPSSRFWATLKTYLLTDKQWQPVAVESINRASDKIVAWLEHPSANRFQTRGLVVGYVQSGKTANFTAVIAKAADVGYRVFIVLAGTKVSLRDQTQRRLDRELVSLNSHLWYTPTQTTDFKLNDNPNYFLGADQNGFLLAVVKKNATVLRRMKKWFEMASPEILRRCPILIIDDEADEASINTAANQTTKDPETYQRTAINKLLVELLETLPKVAYIGYTATPFANVLIDPRSRKDLYPRDFIVALPKPDEHFGTERIFGRERLLRDETDEEFTGLDMVRLVPPDEVLDLQPQSRSREGFTPVLTSSLRDAVIYFWLAAAARWARQQDNEHATMLIHTTQYTDIHEKTRIVVEDYRQQLQQQLSGAERATILQQWRTIWDNEQDRLQPEPAFGLQPVPFDLLQSHIDGIVQQTHIVVDNSRSDNRLTYEDGTRIQIVIGGNTLSRGLTLEGLLVSYFARTANTYDTLLQMGRWFGYRPNYADLPRIWMTDELRDLFFDMATIEAELREEIERYAELGMTPEQFGVRIRMHPALAITARTKMQHAKQTYISYSNNNAQTVLFNHTDVKWLQHNLAATGRLLEDLRSKGIPQTSHEGHQLWYGVPAAMILRFLQAYQFHEMSREVSTKSLTNYIKGQQKHEMLTEWNVVLRGITSNEQSEYATVTLGDIDIPLLKRSRRTKPTDYANIGVLMSSGDTGADLPVKRTAYSSKKAHDIRQMRQMYNETRDRGALIIYCIDKDSQPSAVSAKTKRPLQASDHLVGLAFVFPDAHPNSEPDTKYVSVNPAHLNEYIEPDFLEDDESDA